jgi:hypothetical protein
LNKATHVTFAYSKEDNESVQTDNCEAEKKTQHTKLVTCLYNAFGIIDCLLLKYKYNLKITYTNIIRVGEIIK